MKKMKRVSIIITNYNRVEMVGRAIRSCVDQLTPHRDVEVIVVDDASDDGSAEYLEKYGDSISLVLHQQNMGVAHASNSGLVEATGEYIMRVDSDDYLNTFAVSTMAAILDENPGIAYVYCDLLKVDEQGFPVERIDRGQYVNLCNHGAGILFRKEVVESAGGYDPALLNAEDYDLIVRLCKEHKGFHLPVAYYRYYMHGSNLSQNGQRPMYNQLVEDKNGI